MLCKLHKLLKEYTETQYPEDKNITLNKIEIIINSKNIKTSEVIHHIEDLINQVKRVFDKDANKAVSRITQAYIASKFLDRNTNCDIIKECITHAIEIDSQIDNSINPNLRGFTFPLFVFNRLEDSEKVFQKTREEFLSDTQLDNIIKNIEKYLYNGNSQIDLWKKIQASLDLADYFHQIGKTSEVTKCFNYTTKFCKELIEKSSPLYAFFIISKTFHWGEILSITTNFISDYILYPIKFEHGILHYKKVYDPKHEYKLYFIQDLITGTKEEVITKITDAFIPNKEYLEKELITENKNYYLNNIYKTVVDFQNETIAKIEFPTSDKKNDNLFFYSFDTVIILNGRSIFYYISKITTEYNITPQDYAQYLFKCPLFRENRAIKDILNKAIKAYFDKDYIVSIHLMIPQIEAIIRGLIQLETNSSQSLYQENLNKHKGLSLKLFGKLLEEKTLNKYFNDNIIFYLRLALSDPRGYNLRNKVCHGFLPRNDFNLESASIAFHILLMLSSVITKTQEKED